MERLLQGYPVAERLLTALQMST